LEHLKTQLNTGLDAGITINEITEVLVQLYAYCGFPRSLNGITTFMAVLEERKPKVLPINREKSSYHHRYYGQIRTRQKGIGNTY